MPFKHNDKHRHKFPKAKYRVTNWPEYNEALRRRGDVTVWFDEGLLDKWHAPSPNRRGAQPIYSDVAIEICLTLRVVFGLALRQTQGFVRSLLKLVEIDLPVPDFSTLSRRGGSLEVQPAPHPNAGPITLIVDSAGLQIAGAAGWLEAKHGERKRRKLWRKLHIGLDLESGDIVASCLTTKDVGDPTAMPDLFSQIDVRVTKFIADGAYDGKPVHDSITAHLGPDVEIIIPPPVNAVMGSYPVRDAHLAAIKTKGQTAWQKDTGYTTRSRVEAQIGRTKQVIGPKLRGRKMERQATETTVAIKSLNRMTSLGRAVFERVN